MVQLNLALREISCKIVYFGPGLSGKTTNLEVVHQKAPQDSRGELTSIATESDRTLFFDFMPLNLGTVGGMRTKFQLYTVPGQVYYNSTRKLVLRGADGVVFVADSAPDKMEENIQSLDNLEECLQEQGRSLADFPHVIQFNKRDLDDAVPVGEMKKTLNRHGVACTEAVASEGEGVIETFKALSGLVLKKVKAMAERHNSGARRPPPQEAQPSQAAPPRPGTGSMQKQEGPPARRSHDTGRPATGTLERPGGDGEGEGRRPPPRPPSGVMERAPMRDRRRVSRPGPGQAGPRPSGGQGAGRASRPASQAGRSLEDSSAVFAGAASKERSALSTAAMRRPSATGSSSTQRIIIGASGSRRRQGSGGAMLWIALGAAAVGGLAFAYFGGLL